MLARPRVALACWLVAIFVAGCQRKVSEAHFRLENGLRADLLATGRGDRAALALLFDVGADHDPKDRSGMAHLVEHLFATSGGAEKLPRDFRTLEARYGRGNFHAGTRADFTMYGVEVPAERIIEELDDVAFRMSRLTPTETDLTRERARLLEDVANLQERDAMSAARTRAAESLRPSPGGGLRGGVAAEIEKITLEEVEAFRTHYGATTTRVVVAGHFDVDDVSRRIKARFADIPVGKPPQPRPPAGSRVTGTLVMSEAPTAVALAVPVPELKDPLYPAFLVVAARLPGPGASGLTWQADFAPLTRPDIFFVTSAIPSGQPAEPAAARLRAEVSAIVGAPLAAGEPGRAIDIYGGFLGMTELSAKAVAAAPFDAAFKAGRRAQLGVDGKALAQAVAAATPEQLAAAARLFDTANSTAVLMAAKTPPKAP